mmetsp:Transcript_17549/g.25978  ORF Transcript_17549/g.25978 Transcript_17549/m.25978 type:complete len:742 (-) Transcript_17549:1370-3595(-)|eukprot:CAMPEP_0194206802 /NCGR_PEP_ID=MMETSP0156-20130528/5733_1 /TAXON_ID=33649 /ORGANISM="Thalassionema nitzschioides, Strain L26-B" /LENGTH=741 /DNA_ID=CAMNT_0038933419 /DNA_START=162 /DNA_END=2387 /DNA_ORIENTATION=+
MSNSGQNVGGTPGGNLSDHEIRQRRLLALEQKGPGRVGKEDDIIEDDLKAALVLSLGEEQNQENNKVEKKIFSSKESFDIGEFHTIMWDSKVTTDNDKNRWVGQGIDIRVSEETSSSSLSKTTLTSRLDTMGSNHLPWGLTQAHGGPCGVLAAVQAELIRLLLFGGRDPLSYPTTLPDEEIKEPSSKMSPELIREGLAMAIAVIIARAALMPNSKDEEVGDDIARVILPSNLADSTSLAWKDLEPWSAIESCRSNSFDIHILGETAQTKKRQKTNDSRDHVPRDERINGLALTISKFLLQNSILEKFQRPGGVVLLVMALVASRGASKIANDMDDQSSKLTSQFGHCSQELINLLLTGEAVSNVFDNTMTPSGSFTCRGIQRRPFVGYLTQLEALRYCEVGGYYKNPRFPIWVVGSTSHFTVLFGDVSCLKESKSDELLERCRRAFKEVDGAENGFISRIDLPQVYQILELDVGGDHAIQTLAASLEVSGADIILWDDFWKATSRLAMGASLQTVLEQQGDNIPSSPKLIRGTVEGMLNLKETKPASASAMIESDEEMAKRLAAEWGGGGEISAPARATSPAVAMSDEEYARKLQAELDAEGSGAASVVAVSGSPPRDDDVATQQGTSSDDITTETIEEDQKMSPTSNDNTNGTGSNVVAARPADFETFGDSFPLYHYNGLRGGTLTPFRVTRLSAEEAVGSSIALGGQAAGGGGDLEDVIRTKWPSSMMNWLGKSPPYID